MMSNISTSYLTTVDSQGFTVMETLGLLTRSNGSVVTNILSFVMNPSSLALSTTMVDKSVSYPNSVIRASATIIGPGASLTTGAALSDTRGAVSAISAGSFSRNSSSLRNTQLAPLSAPNQISSSRFADTLSCQRFREIYSCLFMATVIRYTCSVSDTDHPIDFIDRAVYRRSYFSKSQHAKQPHMVSRPKSISLGCRLDYYRADNHEPLEEHNTT